MASSPRIRGDFPSLSTPAQGPVALVGIDAVGHVGLAGRPSPGPRPRKSPRAAPSSNQSQSFAHDDIASFSDMAASAMPLTPGPSRPRESPRGFSGLAEGRQEGKRILSIGLAGAGVVVGAMGGVEVTSSPPPSSRVQQGQVSASPCRSPGVHQTPGLSGNELADISNLFGDTFARELVFSDQETPVSQYGVRPQNDIARLLDDALVREVDPPEPHPIATSQVDAEDGLANELARLCAFPCQPAVASLAPSRPESRGFA